MFYKEAIKNMSIHPSLNLSQKDKKPRSVLKRIERLRIMMEKNQWKEGNAIYGLPKIKTVRIKVKKEKIKEPTAEIPAAEGVTPTANETKEQPATKSQDKK